jgi:Tol biopolymer transport system component
MAVDPDRWHRVELIYHAALAREADERTAFLREACGDDEALRREVESLLAYAGGAQAFLASPALEIVAGALVQPDDVTGPFIGRRLGPYEIGSLLGSGGMGEVYRARDLTLGRDVAIKILPEMFTADTERRARFEREARLLAALNHPHIGAIYGLEQRDGIHALILELIEGDTLAERLRAGPLPLHEALAIARQIAEALEAAHEKGIVHRDLKPANITLTADGVVKVLDFGLAKGTEEWAPDLTQSPTITVGATHTGVILGTAAYMSPEQARGKVVDKRTDIWAFGCIVYELLTGRSAFARDTVSDTVAAILEREPDWQLLPAATPAIVTRMLHRCLEKDPKRRLHDIADARIDIDDALESRSASVTADVREPVPLQRIGPWIVSGLLAAALIAALGIRFVDDRPPGGITRFTIALPPHVELRDPMVLSPDGRTLVYTGVDDSGSRLYKRALDSLESVPIRGTEGGSQPFFSPDGTSIGFVVGRALKRVPLQGGAPVTVYGADAKRATWLTDDTIVYQSLEDALMRVSANGGEARQITTLDRGRGEIEHHSPVALPGGHAVLFTVHSGARDSQRIDAISLESGERTPVGQGSGARFLPTGHITFAFQREGALWVAPFDEKRLRLTAPATAVVEGVTIAAGWVPMIAVGTNGSLAYATGKAASEEYQLRTLLWVDKHGREIPIDAPARAWAWPHISPDGRRLGVHIHDPANMDAWIYELDHGPLMRVTWNPAQDGYPLWSPDGTRIVFWSNQGGGLRAMHLRRADLSGTDERITTGSSVQLPFSWTRDGKHLVFQEISRDTGSDIGVISLEGDRTPQWVIRGPADEGRPAVSADGRWIAYQSNLSGRWEVYVQPFQGASGRWQVSTQGGLSPIWSPDGRELFYRNGRAVMSVPVTALGDAFTHGNARVLFEGSYVPEYVGTAEARSYALAPDGQRFLMMKDAVQHDESSNRMQVVGFLKWAEELKRLVPSAR